LFWFTPHTPLPHIYAFPPRCTFYIFFWIPATRTAHGSAPHTHSLVTLDTFGCRTFHLLLRTYPHCSCTPLHSVLRTRRSVPTVLVQLRFILLPRTWFGSRQLVTHTHFTHTVTHTHLVLTTTLTHACTRCVPQLVTGFYATRLSHTYLRTDTTAFTPHLPLRTRLPQFPVLLPHLRSLHAHCALHTTRLRGSYYIYQFTARTRTSYPRFTARTPTTHTQADKLLPGSLLVH